MMLADLRSYILAEATVAALIVDRFYANAARASPTSPYCVYRVVAETVENTHDAEEAELNVDTVQIDVYGDTFASVSGVKDALKKRLNSKAAIQDDTDFGYIEWQSAFSDYEESTNEHRWTITIGVTWKAV